MPPRGPRGESAPEEPLEQFPQKPQRQGGDGGDDGGDGGEGGFEVDGGLEGVGDGVDGGAVPPVEHLKLTDKEKEGIVKIQARSDFCSNFDSI
jgi:hypothetical protein